MTKAKDWSSWTPEKNNVLPLNAKQGEAERDARSAAARPLAKPAKPFDYFKGKLEVDAASREAPLPECAALHQVPEFPQFETMAHFVPVSFVAMDWKVTPRRVRFLLTSGRLAGRRQENGYWEVRYPYMFTFGTRGPALKRSQQPKNTRQKPVLVAV